MNVQSIILLIIIFIGVVAAVIYILRHDSCSGCNGDCSQCKRNAPK